MGWGRMLLLGNFGQQLDIEEQKQELRELRDRMESGSNSGDMSMGMRLDMLERQSDELKLYLAAIVRHLTAKGAITMKDFEKLVDEIDGEDGASDGRYKGRVL